jgi:hypothetical protein
VLVPVTGVSCVSVSVVEIVDVVTVRNGDMPTAFAVRVSFVSFRLGVARLALIPVVIVPVVHVPVMEVVDMVLVGDRCVSAVRAVGVLVISVAGAGHAPLLSSAWAMASNAMWVTCSSAIE